jgi:hypothetical protein
MLVNGKKHCPHGTVDSICPNDGHGDSHRWRMSKKRAISMARLNNEAGPDRLLAAIFGDDVLLHSGHELVAEEPDDGQIYAAVHQAERIGRADHAVKRVQLLERGVGDTHVGVIAKVAAPGGAEFWGEINEGETKGHLFSVPGTPA